MSGTVFGWIVNFLFFTILNTVKRKTREDDLKIHTSGEDNVTCCTCERAHAPLTAYCQSPRTLCGIQRKVSVTNTRV